MMGLIEADALQTKPYKMKKIIGNVLCVASFITWAAIAMLPLVSLSIEMAAAITMILIVFGEIAFVLSMALLGKEFFEKMKIQFRKLFGKQ